MPQTQDQWFCMKFLAFCTCMKFKVFMQINIKYNHFLFPSEPIEQNQGWLNVKLYVHLRNNEIVHNK